jgi:hypothetical protein
VTGRLLPAGALALGALLAAAAPPAEGAVQPLERELAFEELRAVRSAAGPWMDVELPGGELAVGVGEPALPSVRVRLPLPAGLAVADVRLEILTEELQDLPLPVTPYPGAQSYLDPRPPEALPDPAVYACADWLPARAAALVGTVELTTGTRVAVVRVHPARLRPAMGQLQLIRRARLIVTLKPAEGSESGSAMRRIRPPLATLAAARSAQDSGGSVLLVEQGFVPREIPTVEGSPVEYLIISPSDEDMVTEWQRLADWKTDCGHPALVVTLDEIDAAVPAASDLPEKMRIFIRDAYVHWGLRWVLLGADTQLVPTRFALSWGQSNEGLGTEVSSDYYFACLDGTWDADQDGIFGEADYIYNPGGGDFVDFVSEIHVGRVSAKNATQVADYLDKYFVYVQTPPDDGYLDRVTLIGEVLFPVVWSRYGLNGGPDCNHDPCDAEHCRVHEGTPVCATDHNDGAIDCWDIEDTLRVNGYEGEIVNLVERVEYWWTHPEDPHPDAMLENTESVLSALNTGTSMIMQSGHADRDRWAVGDGRLLMSELGLLQNGWGGHFFWAHTTNCKSAAIEYDSFGEAMLLLPGHGAVGYVGTTHVNWPSKARTYNADFFHFAYLEPGTTIGDGLFGSLTAHSIPDTVNASLHQDRFLLFSYVLLGDPGMVFWQATPMPLDVSFDSPAHLGAGALTVNVQTSLGTAVADARVCLRKHDEVYVVGLTGADGSVELPFWPETSGAFQVTVTSPTGLPTSATGMVSSPSEGPALVLADIQFLDDGRHSSKGNDNGVIEVGETIRVSLTLRNDGPGDATVVEARLVPTTAVPTGLLTFPDFTAGFGRVAPGEEETVEKAFLFEVAGDPDGELLGELDVLLAPLQLDVEGAEGELSTIINVEIARPRIEVAINEWNFSPSDSRADVYLGLMNRGRGTASNLVATLTGDIHTVTIVPGSVPVPEIMPGDTVRVGPFEIAYEEGAQSAARVDLRVTDPQQLPIATVHTRSIDLVGPAGPDSLVIQGHASDDMILRWKEAVDAGGDEIVGYKIYRAEGESGVWTDVFIDIMHDHTYLTDFGLEPRTLYRYGVRAVDAGGNLGEVSEIVSEYTRAATLSGWPRELILPTTASPLICELDGVTSPWDGRNMREIVFCGERVYAFHGDGSDLVDGDGNPLTVGPFSALEGEDDEFWCKPAAGDLDGDGHPEVLAISFMNKTISCWSRFGGDPRWTYSFPAGNAWNSPTLADLDDDGTLEVIFCGGPGGHEGIYVLNHNGEAFQAGNPQIIDLGERYLYQPPSVGYVDDDDWPDIVILSRFGAALHVIEGVTGDEVEGFEGGVKFQDYGSSATRGKSSPALADVDGDGLDEIFVVTADRIWCFEYAEDLYGQGEVNMRWYAGYDTDFSLDVEPEPVLGELYEEYPGPEVVVVEMRGKVWAWDALTGVVVPGFPFQIGEGGSVEFGTPILANVDSDVRPDIIVADSDKHIHAYTMDGLPAEGFPLAFSGLPKNQSLAAWDVDDDGYQNLVGQAKGNQTLTVWDLQGVEFDPAHNPWPMRFRDACNTGRYTPLDAVAVLLVMEEAVVDPEGRVQLTWRCAEPVLGFRILRSGPVTDDLVVVGEVSAGGRPGSQIYRFEDDPGAAGTYTYEIQALLPDGQEQFATSVTILIPSAGAGRLAFARVSPRPIISGQAAAIIFTIPGTGTTRTPVHLRVLDLQGRLASELIAGQLAPGTHTLAWDGRDEAGRRLPSGLYLLRLEALGRVAHQRVLVMR